MNMKKRYDYESDWSSYVFPPSSAHFASEDELAAAFSRVDMTHYPTKAAGIPLHVKDGLFTLNDETENTLVFGETGSKKTRCVIRPLMYSLMAKGESMIVTDPKGELATDPKLRGFLDERGYKTVFVDFRGFSSDRYNIFDNAIRLYREGKKGKAVEDVSNIIHALAEGASSPRSDPFWKITAEELCIPIVHILLETFAQESPENVSMATVANLVSEDGVEFFEEQLRTELEDVNNSSISMLRGALCGSDKTTANVTVSAYSILQPFLFNPGLMRMMSSSTFDISKLYEEKTAVFLIVPDELSTYDKIAGIVIDSFYRRLIAEYTEKYQNRQNPPCRVNFVCDEFCNITINDMGPKISACRSREIRFTLVCQSLSQLEKSYPDDAQIIIGNCKNILFLKSSDPNLLAYISDLCGLTNVTKNGEPEPLVSTAMLKNLKKERNYKEAIFLRDDLVYRATLPDCDAPAYAFLDKFGSADPAVIPIYKKTTPDGLTLNDVKEAVPCGTMVPLFLEDRSMSYEEYKAYKKEKRRNTLEALFGDIDEEDENEDTSAE